VESATLRYWITSAMHTGEQGGQAEFEAFYARTARHLHGYLCRLGRDSAIADEILQESYVRMINAPNLDDQARKSYLYRTATNLLRDVWRRRKLEKEYWLREPVPEAVLPNLNLSLDVAAVFEKLSPVDRAVLWLAYVEQMRHRETAAILGLKEKSIKVIAFRARNKAKELFEKEGWGAAHETDR